MPRRSILSAAERESLPALPDTKDESIRHSTFNEIDRIPLVSDPSLNASTGGRFFHPIRAWQTLDRPLESVEQSRRDVGSHKVSASSASHVAAGFQPCHGITSSTFTSRSSWNRFLKPVQLGRRVPLS